MASYGPAQASPDQQSKGKVIVVCSASGGMGRSSVTLNLAALAARQSVKVDVIDGDLQFGDLALSLNLRPSLSIEEAAERKDVSNIREYCIAHESGLQLLAAPSRPEFADLVSPEFVTSVLEELSRDSGAVILETQAGLNEDNLQFMELADSIIVVASTGMAAIKNTKLMIETIKALGMKEKVIVVVNKCTDPSLIHKGMIPELVDEEKVFFLPNIKKQMSHSLDLGKPFVAEKPKHKYARQLVKVSNELFLPESAEKMKTNRFSLKQKLSKERGWEHHELAGETTVKNPGGNKTR